MDDKNRRDWHKCIVYDPNNDPKIAYDALKDGLGLAAVGAALNVGRATVIRWRHLYPEFNEAVEAGLQQGELYWDKLAKEHTVIVTEKDGPKVEFKDGVYKFVKKITYGAREHDDIRIAGIDGLSDQSKDQARVQDIVIRLQTRDD